MQTLEGKPSARAALQAHIKTQLGSLTASPVSPEAMQTQRGGRQLVSFVMQEPTRQPMVPKLNAQPVILENLNSIPGGAYAMTATLASTA